MVLAANLGVEVSSGEELPETFDSGIAGRVALELAAMDLDWDSTSIIGVRNNITSEDDDSPSPPPSLRGNPSE